MSTYAAAKASAALSKFIKTNGSNQENSFCTGAYNLAEYHLYSPAECAAKCLANKACTHFRMCTEEGVSNCCALSSTCTLPYTTASEKWDGYLNYEISSKRAAASSTPVESMQETFEVEPLCTARTAPINLAGATATVDESNGLDMLWKGVATVGGDSVDLLITSEGREYLKGEGGTYQKGGVGIINLKMGTSVDLLFKFQSASTGECIDYDEIHFTVLDVHKNGNMPMEMEWEFQNVGGVVAKSEPEVLIEEVNERKTKVKASAGEFCPSEDIVPSDLKEVQCKEGTVSYEQDKRAAMMVFKRTCEFKATLFAPGPPEFTYGWPFTFAFTSELAELCT